MEPDDEDATVRSALVWGCYALAVAFCLFLFPRATLQLVGISTPATATGRVLALMVSGLGIYYIDAARSSNQRALGVTVLVRLASFFGFALVAILEDLPLLFGVGMLEAVGAVWCLSLIHI